MYSALVGKCENAIVIAFLVLCFSSKISIAQNKSITFQNLSLVQAKEKSLQENKFIFIAVSTSRCRPCKEMEKTVFKNDTVIEYFNSEFINLKIDLEFGEGMHIDSIYEVNSLPAYLFIDGNGKLQHRTGGRMSVRDFLSEATTANLRDQNLAYYKSMMPVSKTDKAFLLKYIHVLKKSELLNSTEAKEALEIYFSKTKPEELLEVVNWNIFPCYSGNFLSPQYNFLIANKEKFDSLYSPEVVDEKIRQIVWDTLEKISYQEKFNKLNYDIVKAKALSANLQIIKKTVFEMDMNLLHDKDWNTFQKRCIQQVDSLYADEAWFLNYYAQTFCNKIEDKNALLKAEQWARQSTLLEPEFANTATYALLLYKNEKYQLANQEALKAIEFAKTEGLKKEDYKFITKIVSSIKKNPGNKTQILN